MRFHSAFVKTSAGKPRMVVAYNLLNDACQAATCHYESIDNLVDLLTPKSWLLSLDLTAAYHHCAIAPAHRKYTGFHLALPYRCSQGVIPLQVGGYYGTTPPAMPSSLTKWSSSAPMPSTLAPGRCL